MLAVLAMAMPVRPVVGQAAPDFPLTRFTLANGLDVVLAPDSTFEETSIELWVRVGARDESPGQFGLAHFYEHATPFGFGVGRTTLGRQLIDSLRTDSNARTRYDYTLYYTQTRAAGLDLFLRALADRLAADPTHELTPEHTEWHRVNVAAEIARQRSGLSGWLVRSRLQAGTFGAGHPYGHAVYGSDVETAAVTTDHLIRWSRANLRPEYSTLIVVGRMDTAATRVAVERYFGGIPGGARPIVRDWHPEITTAVSDSVVNPAETHHLLLSWPSPAWGADQQAAMEVGAWVLDARLKADRPEWIASATARLEVWQLAGRFGLVAEVRDRADLERAERWLRERLTRLLDDGPTAAELETARMAIRGDLTDWMSRLGWADSRSQLLGESVLFTGDPAAWRDLLRRKLAVTVEEVRNATRRWLATPGFTLRVIGRT